MTGEVVHGVPNTDQESNINPERDERDERGDEAEKRRDEHQGQVIGDREQESEERHDCSYSILGWILSTEISDDIWNGKEIVPAT